MSLRRSRFKTFDQRTGRLERAVVLIEDGETGMLVRRGENDRKHPLSREFVPPIDRATLLGPAELERQPGTTVIDVGYTAPGSNFERPNMGTFNIPQTGGTFVAFVQSGYGEFGYGALGYGGSAVEGDETGW